MGYLIPTTPPNVTTAYTSHRATDSGTGQEWTVYYNPHHVDFRPLHGDTTEHQQRVIALAQAMSGRNAGVYKKERHNAAPEYGVRVRYDGAVPTFGGNELSQDVP